MTTFRIEKGKFIEVEEMDCTVCVHNTFREKGTKTWPFVTYCEAHNEVYIGNAKYPDCKEFQEI